MKTELIALRSSQLWGYRSPWEGGWVVVCVCVCVRVCVCWGDDSKGTLEEEQRAGHVIWSLFFLLYAIWSKHLQHRTWTERHAAWGQDIVLFCVCVVYTDLKSLHSFVSLKLTGSGQASCPTNYHQSLRLGRDLCCLPLYQEVSCPMVYARWFAVLKRPTSAPCIQYSIQRQKLFFRTVGNLNNHCYL